MGRAAPPFDKPRAKVKWSPNDTVDLLARLDFIVTKIRETSGWASKHDVLQQLKSSLKKRRTLRQIESKFKSLNGSGGPKALEDIYRYGSNRVPGLDSNLRLRVCDELQIIQSKEIGILVSTPRQLRSASQNLGIDSSRPRRENTLFVERTPTRSMPRSRHGNPEVLISRFGESESQSNEDPLDQETITVRRRSNSRTIAEPLYACTASTEEDIKSSRSSNIFREGSHNEFHNLDGTPTPQPILRPSLYALEIKNHATIDYSDPNTIRHMSEKVNPGVMHETLRDLFSDNLYFRKRLSESEQRFQKIERNERLKHSLLASGSRDVALVMADTIDIQNEKLNNLQHRLSNQRILQQFQMLGRGEEVPLNQSQIQLNHKKMRRGFKSLSIMDCFQHPLKASAFTESQYLEELRSLVLSNLLDYPVELIIQSLTGAAVCKWVFNEKIQCAAMMGSPLLQGYRSQLETVCGEIALRNVDLAAHQWVINDDKYFQEQFLPRTATQLSGRLLSALGPFIKHKEKQGARLQTCLESIFCAALNIKTLAMIGKNVFECIWPSHNARFERYSMEDESPERTLTQKPSSKQREKRVMLALVPGLLVYNSDRKLVDYCGFSNGDEAKMKQPSLVAQAVVASQR